MSKLGLRLHADEEHWIPLSDLMTGLMFLFLLIAIAYMVEVETQHAKPEQILKTYAATRAGLYDELNAQFGAQLRKWHGRIDPNTLSVRFYGKGLFAEGSSQLQPGFKVMLDDFFPRFAALLDGPKYRGIVSEIRIEGFTSSAWVPGASLDQRYIGNMQLSQDRTRSVLQYVLALPAVQPNRSWLTQTVSADGFSFSHLIRRPDGAEDPDASQRVEFRVVTNANDQISKALRARQTPSAQSTAASGQAQVPTLNAPLPPIPAWAKPLLGQSLTVAFPQRTTTCFGYLDGLATRYTGKPAGDKFFGWAYDVNAKQPVQRVLLVNRGGRIAGAGAGGFARPDVPATLPSIASMTTGWEGYARAGVGDTMTAWAVNAETRSACRLNLAHVHAGDTM